MLLNPGVVLGGRYEIIEKIGSGGMAVVYRGKDRKLDRYVTIKVLREEYIQDEEFIGRFRTEACSAARLSHPNIVRVYDVGEDGDVNYIVMEYIHGDTLKMAIRKKAPFDSRSTINVAIQIASALAQAHKAHIVHRDIKPQNILVGTDGVVKVTDFGIARAATVSTMTTTANAAGSVHYFSPEQARGGYVDEKSDIYSLGITMFEMITGVLPFQGNNSVSIALKHINEELPDIRQYNPNCTRSLEGIIKKATMKKADERYSNISLMLSDLIRARSELAQNTGNEQAEAAVHAATAAMSHVYVNAQGQERKEEPHEGIRMSRRAEAAREMQKSQENMQKPNEPLSDDVTRKADAEEIDLIRLKKKETVQQREEMSQREEWGQREGAAEERRGKKIQISKEDAYEGEYMAAERVKASKRPPRRHRNPRKEADYDNERDRKAERKVIGAAIATSVVIILLISIFSLRALGGFGTNKDIVLPDFIGMTYEEAVEAAEEKGLVLEKEGEDYSSYYDAGCIFWQSTKEGSKVSKKTKIGVKVSLGLNSEKMPDLENKDEQKAKEEIISLVGKAPTIRYQESDEVEPSKVISQKPAPGSKIDAYTKIVLIVSKGGTEDETLITVPDVQGMSEEKAKRTLEGAGLTVGSISRIESDSVGAGKVITQTLTPNSEASEGSVVNLVISTGAPKDEEEPPKKEETVQNETTNNNGGGSQVVQPTGGTKYYTLTAPAEAGDTVRVRVVKTDVDGVSVVVDDTKKLSELPFSIPVTGKGNGNVTCYMDGVEQWSESVNFAE